MTSWGSGEQDLYTLEIILEEKLGRVDKRWQKGDLLAQRGFFLLEDVAGLLDLTTANVKKKASDLERQGRSPWREMGLVHLMDRWVLRMDVFRKYLGKHRQEKIRQVERHWDANQLLAQEGLFFLEEVCRKIPFTEQQLRYKANQHPHPRHGLGTWKDPEKRVFLVDMAVFSRWIRRIWHDVSVLN